ncbi:MAG: 3-methyl-2-oxobutanoate hydroxymethyltransferase [Planctomycetota bacterium]
MASKARRRMTVPRLMGMKAEDRKISMLTAYDFTLARIIDEAGTDVILVGDSMGMVVQGHENTLPVTLDQMIYHAEMVGRAARKALVVVDMPFPTYHLGVEKAIEHAGRILKETRCQAVKLEGGADQADVIRGLVRAGIPVMAHVGLRPQNIHQLGGYRVSRDAEVLLDDALAAEAAGAFSIVLECMPASIATTLTQRLVIPTIGIGAGPHCDGQVLVTHDLLGMSSGYVPKHARQYVDLGEVISKAVVEYGEDVRRGRFPAEENQFE